MRKVHLMSSLLLAFCASMFGLGCGDAKKPEPKMTGPAPVAAKTDSAKTDDTKATAATDDAAKTSVATNDSKPETPKKSKKLTGKKIKPAGAGSTTGGGVELPAATAGGVTEKPADKAEDKPADATKPEDKPEEKKAEEK